MFKLSKYKNIFQDNLLRGTATLSSAAVLGQIITVLSSTILTRLYSPEDFGVQAVFLSVLAPIAVLASLRYEWAIVLPKHNKTALYLLLACFLSTIGVSILALIVVSVWGSYLVEATNLEAIEPFLLIIPPATLMLGFYQSLNYWFLREKNFSEIAKTKLSQSLSTSFAQISLGWVISGPVGLLIGAILNSSVGTIRLLSITLNKYAKELSEISLKQMIVVCVKYYKFPVFSVWSSLINSAGLVTPVFMLSHFYSIEDVGSFSLAQRLIAIPITVIGKSIFQVFLSDAPRLVVENPRKLKEKYISTTLILIAIASLISAVFWFSPVLFPIFFGNEWQQSGALARFMIPFFISSFAVSSLSILDWLDRQNWMFYWNTIRFVFIALGFYVAGLRMVSLNQSILMFSYLTTALYVCLFMLNLLAIKRIESHKALEVN